MGSIPVRVTKNLHAILSRVFSFSVRQKSSPVLSVSDFLARGFSYFTGLTNSPSVVPYMVM